jgi:uncharacterized membrane protein
MSERRFPWRTLLFVSVALNLVTIGAAIGAFTAGVRLQREAPGAVVDRLPGPRAFMAALPAETRAKVRGEFQRSWEESREARQTAGQARRDAFEAAAAEPYDREAVRAAFSRLREADQRAIGVFHDNVADAFAELTPQERRRALAALRRAPPETRRRLAPDDAAIEPDTEDADPPRTLRELREERRERRRERRERLREATPQP